MIFHVCYLCYKGDCDCRQYDGLEKGKMPKDWKPHDDSKHSHKCHCVFGLQNLVCPMCNEEKRNEFFLICKDCSKELQRRVKNDVI